MQKDSFQFKQFTIRQHLCAMKVGTDGVLLGAWAKIAAHTIDVGTGTGLIALMLAQRDSEALIDAIEIDENACLQAKDNALASPFADRIRVFHSSLSVYAANTEMKYDLVISNPPYFEQSLKGPNQKRNAARHTDSLPLEDLIEKGRSLLSPTGRIALVLPADREDHLRGVAVENQLNVIRLTRVIPKAGAHPKRILTELSADFALHCTPDTLQIEDSPGKYSTGYIELTMNFYLNM
ncbi:tRNA1(Val) (adenine(37)-N6)-methyltransferase [Alphaproteobacteria bacterium]|nr:tRNA1(Val) (adenine(37)-N6)-methyltransferase [Alphaproteobacteria bacterium]